MDETQRMVSEYVIKNTPIEDTALRQYLRDENVPEDEIKRVMIGDIVELTLDSGVSLRSPFDYNKTLGKDVAYKTLGYNTNIVVKEKKLEAATGLREPLPNTTGLIYQPPEEHTCIRPSPDTIVTITSRTYHFCPTEEVKKKVSA